MDYRAALKDYASFEFTDGPWTREVFRRGQGPAVIVIHEMPGLHPLVVRFADHVAAAGMTVFMPSLFGTPGRPVTVPYALGEMIKGICIAREFNVWSTQRSSPIVDWLRALARAAHASCGGKGVGAVGMCFTGGFALRMMTVAGGSLAPVLSQPSMPLAAGSKKRAAGYRCLVRRNRLREIALRQGEDLSMIGLRFFGDNFVPDARFDTAQANFFWAINLRRSRSILPGCRTSASARRIPC